MDSSFCFSCGGFNGKKNPCLNFSKSLNQGHNSVFNMLLKFNTLSTKEPTVKPTDRQSYKPLDLSNNGKDVGSKVKVDNDNTDDVDGDGQPPSGLGQPIASRDGEEREEGEEEDDDEQQTDFPLSSAMPSQISDEDGDDEDGDGDGEQSQYSVEPSVVPTTRKTRTRTTSPSFQTTFTPLPSFLPTVEIAPSLQPTALSTKEPTVNPSISPSFQSTAEGTTAPSFQTVATTTSPSQLKFLSPNPTYNPTIPHEISISTLSIELLLYAIAFGIILGTIVTSAICCCIYFMLYPRPPTQSALSVLNPTNIRYSPLPTSNEQSVEMVETPLH